MLFPQVIRMQNAGVDAPASYDAVLAFDGYSVIDDTDQLPLGGAPHSLTTITVTVSIYDLTVGAIVSPVTDVTMTYQTSVDMWTINCADIVGLGAIKDRHKYVGLIVATDSSNMRQFKINEFTIENESFEATLMRLPYQVEIGTPSYIKWYATTGDFGGTSLYQAEIYEGAIGTTAATSAATVTHRGPIVPTPLV